MTDAQLLTEFAEKRSSEAFSVLVGRYIDLVYATAKRIAGDGDLAEDVVQTTFIVLAKKAKTLKAATLPGWLVNTTRLAAKEALRAKLRWTRSKKEIGQMRSEIQSTRDEPAANEVAPFLDAALSRLNDGDRSAVVMRFLQGKRFAEVGKAMGISEEAARKRVERALERLRAIFLKHDFRLSVGGLMVVLVSQQASRAPAALASAVSGHSTVSGTTGASVLAKKVLATMKIQAIKLAAAFLLVPALAIAGVGIHMFGVLAAESKETGQKITIRVVDSNGKPVKDVLLGSYADWSEPGAYNDNRPSPDIGFFGPRARIVSDEKGEASISAEQLFGAGKRAMLYAMSSDLHWVAIAQAQSGSRSFQLTLEPACRLHGSILSNQFEGKIDSTHVDISKDKAEIQICCNSTHGNFEMMLPPGTYTINAFGQSGDKIITGLSHVRATILPTTRGQLRDVQLIPAPKPALKQ